MGTRLSTHEAFHCFNHPALNLCIRYSSISAFICVISSKCWNCVSFRYIFTYNINGYQLLIFLFFTRFYFSLFFPKFSLLQVIMEDIDPLFLPFFFLPPPLFSFSLFFFPFFLPFCPFSIFSPPPRLGSTDTSLGLRIHPGHVSSMDTRWICAGTSWTCLGSVHFFFLFFWIMDMPGHVVGTVGSKKYYFLMKRVVLQKY